MHKSVAIGIGFNSDWVKKWYTFIKPNMKPNTRMKTAYTSEFLQKSSQFTMLSSLACMASEERMSTIPKLLYLTILAHVTLFFTKEIMQKK